jgi:hypothetical protein
LLDLLVIPIGTRWKRFFDLVLTVMCVFNVFSNGYYAAFGLPPVVADRVIDIFVEFLFLLDMIFNFFTEYKDTDTFEIDSSFVSIAKRYCTKLFLFDFIAWFPIEYISNFRNIRIFRLLKMMRIPRLAELLDVEKFKTLVADYHN